MSIYAHNYVPYIRTCITYECLPNWGGPKTRLVLVGHPNMTREGRSFVALPMVGSKCINWIDQVEGYPPSNERCKKKTRIMTGSRPASTVFQAYFPCSKLPRDTQPYVPNLEGFRLSNNAAKYSRIGKVEGKIVSRSLEIGKRKFWGQWGGIVNVCHDASAKLLEDWCWTPQTSLKVPWRSRVLLPRFVHGWHQCCWNLNSLDQTPQSKHGNRSSHSGIMSSSL